MSTKLVILPSLLLVILALNGCKTVTMVEEQSFNIPTPTKTADDNPSPARITPSPTQATILLARDFEEQNRIEEAAQVYEQLIQEQGEIPVAVHRLAVIQSQLGNDKKAEDYFRRAAELDRTNADLLCDYGFHCFRKNRLMQAETNYMAALNIDPELSRARNNLAVLYVQTQRRELALEQFEKAGCDPHTARNNLRATTMEAAKPKVDVPMMANAPAIQHVRTARLPKKLESRQIRTNVPTNNFSSPPSPATKEVVPATSQPAEPEVGQTIAPKAPPIEQVAFWEKNPPRPSDQAAAQKSRQVDFSRLSVKIVVDEESASTSETSVSSRRGSSNAAGQAEK